MDVVHRLLIAKHAIDWPEFDGIGVGTLDSMRLHLYCKQFRAYGTDAQILGAVRGSVDVVDLRNRLAAEGLVYSR